MFNDVVLSVIVFLSYWDTIVGGGLLEDKQLSEARDLGDYVLPRIGIGIVVSLMIAGCLYAYGQHHDPSHPKLCKSEYIYKADKDTYVCTCWNHNPVGFFARQREVFYRRVNRTHHQLPLLAEDNESEETVFMVESTPLLVESQSLDLFSSMQETKACSSNEDVLFNQVDMIVGEIAMADSSSVINISETTPLL